MLVKINFRWYAYYRVDERKNNMENIKRQKTNNGSNKKLITSVFAIILFIVILVVSTITFVSTVKASNLAFLKYRFYIMHTNSYPNIAKIGDLVIAKKQKPGNIKPQDNIVYKDGRYYHCSSIIETKTQNIVNKYIIAEKDGIRYQFSEDDISGKVVFVIPSLGSVISFFRTTLGFLFFLVILALTFIILRLVYVRSGSTKSEEKSDTDIKSE